MAYLSQIMAQRQQQAMMARASMFAAPQTTAGQVTSAVLGAPPPQSSAVQQQPTSMEQATAAAVSQAPVAASAKQQAADAMTAARTTKRSNGYIKTGDSVARGQAFHAGVLPPGAAGRANKGVKQTPVVSPAVAHILDTYSDLDQVQSSIAVLRRAATLMSRGFVKSAQTKVVYPPDYAAEAASQGLPAPNMAREVTGVFQPETAPAEVVNVAQGEMVGKDIDPERTARVQAASVQPVLEGAQTTSMAVNAGAIGGGGAVGYTPASTVEGVIAGNAMVTTEAVNEGEAGVLESPPPAGDGLGAPVPVEPVSESQPFVSNRGKSMFAPQKPNPPAGGVAASDTPVVKPTAKRAPRKPAAKKAE